MSTPSLIATEKARLQERAAQDIYADYEDYRQEVLTDGNAEDKRKLVDMQMKLIGAEMDKKSGVYDGLAVFHFHMAAPGESMALEVVQEAPKAIEAPWPFKDVVEAGHGPADAAPEPHTPPSADDLLESLDVMLGALPLDD